MIRKIAIIFSISLMAAALAFFLLQPPPAKALNPNHSCDTCHNLHSAPGQALSSYTVVEDLCLSCHGPAGTATKKAEVHTNKQSSSYSFTMTCLDCHNPHDNRANHVGGTNIMMVGSRLDGTGNAMIATPNSGNRYVAFENRGSDADPPYDSSLHSFADGDEDNNGIYDGACEVCHTLAANHRNNNSGNHAHYTGTDCMACHSHTGNFLAEGGGCTACHGGPQDKGDGGPTRRGMTGEFSLLSHHVAGGAVTDDDCGVCHYESIDSAYHQDNKVDLRNPDNASVGALISFAQFSRNTASDSLESWVTDVQDNFCMKCHDADGATATNFSGNALQPFSSPSRDAPDVFSRFATSNGSHHAVRGPGINPYCVPSTTNGNKITMEPPWNQDANHDVISCFDCHGTSGHGSGNQRMLLTPVDFDSLGSGVLDYAVGAQVETFCTLCHKSSVYVTSGGPESAGSIFEFHGAAQSQHANAGANELGCIGCHAGVYDHSAGVPPAGNGSAWGNIHGVSFTWPSGTFSAGEASEHFMVGGWNSGWMLDTNKGNPIGACGGGDCNHTGGTSRAGKTYTRN